MNQARGAGAKKREEKRRNNRAMRSRKAAAIENNYVLSLSRRSQALVLARRHTALPFLFSSSPPRPWLIHFASAASPGRRRARIFNFGAQRRNRIESALDLSQSYYNLHNNQRARHRVRRFRGRLFLPPRLDDSRYFRKK